MLVPLCANAVSNSFKVNRMWTFYSPSPRFPFYSWHMVHSKHLLCLTWLVVKGQCQLWWGCCWVLGAFSLAWCHWAFATAIVPCPHLVWEYLSQPKRKRHQPEFFVTQLTLCCSNYFFLQGLWCLWVPWPSSQSEVITEHFHGSLLSASHISISLNPSLS